MSIDFERNIQIVTALERAGVRANDSSGYTVDGYEVRVHYFVFFLSPARGFPARPLQYASLPESSLDVPLQQWQCPWTQGRSRYLSGVPSVFPSAPMVCELRSQFSAVFLVTQSTIRFSATGAIVSSMLLYSFGAPVLASCKR